MLIKSDSIRFNEAGAINPGKPPGRAEDQREDEGASMRPGRLTPENASESGIEALRSAGFNEAGAINPGKPPVASAALQFFQGFNEAGAINPGKLAAYRHPEPIKSSFNEAGAINPGKQRE